MQVTHSDEKQRPQTPPRQKINQEIEKGSVNLAPNKPNEHDQSGYDPSEDNSFVIKLNQAKSMADLPLNMPEIKARKENDLYLHQEIKRLHQSKFRKN